MSEYDDVETQRTEGRTPEARVHLGKWSPWVWVIPALAIFFAGYLVVRYGFFGGGDVTVTFADARGLDRYSPVRFRGAKVGTVQKITIGEDLNSVVVRISMDASMNHALRKGTKFWIEEPGVSGGGIGGILSGTSVGIAPGEGAETREYVGQEYPPVLTASEAGRTYILEADRLGSLAAGSPVQFNGMRVGRVLGAEYDEARRVTLIHVFVVQRFQHHVRQSTRFWRAGGLDVSLSGGGLSLSGASLGSVLNSPVAFYTPDVLAGAEVAEGTHFDLYESESMAEASADGPNLTYAVYFAGPVKGLTPGTPVQMRGVQVGRVRDVKLRYVPQSASLETPVILEIDPRKLDFNVTDTMTRDDVRARLNEAIDKLVRKGMRASLSSSLVLPGAGAVTLDIVGRPGTARLVTTQDPPAIPAASAGSGLEGALAAVNDVAARIRNLPIEEIAENLRQTSVKMNSIAHDPALQDSLQRMNRAMEDFQKSAAVVRENAGPIMENVRTAADYTLTASKDIKSTAATAKENVGPIVESLRNAATAAESAAGRANTLMGSTPKQNYDLASLVRELTRAAQSVRSLASYIEENPDALLKGRGK